MALFSKKKQSDIPRRRQGQPAERATESSLTDRYAFQRNRTLTGSASSNVSSTNETGAQLKSSRVQAHELVHQRRRVGVTLLGVFLVCFALFILVFEFTASAVVRGKDISIKLDPVYEQAIQEYLGRQPIERLRFALDTKRLTAFVQDKAPEVESVTTEGFAGFGKSSFVLTLREPIAGWNVGGSQQYVDNTGTAFSKSYYDTPKVQIIDNSGVPTGSGPVASNRFLGFVGRVVGLAKNRGYIAQEVIIPTGTTRQVELKLEGVGYPIKFSVDRGAGEQVEDMARAIKWLSGHGVAPQYLDVRVSGKAFYK